MRPIDIHSMNQFLSIPGREDPALVDSDGQVPSAIPLR